MAKEEDCSVVVEEVEAMSVFAQYCHYNEVHSVVKEAVDTHLEVLKLVT